MLYYQLLLDSLFFGSTSNTICCPLAKGKRTKLLSDPDKAWGCSTNTFVTDYFIE